jgi:hypothetical protein
VGSWQDNLAVITAGMGTQAWSESPAKQLKFVEFLAEYLDVLPLAQAATLLEEGARGMGTTEERLKGILDLTSRRDRRRAVLACARPTVPRLPEELDNEVPFGWNFWCGLTALGVCCRRNLYFDRDLFYLYPNLYTVLVGPTGAHKSTCIDLMTEMVRTANEFLEPRVMEKQEDIRVVVLPAKTTAEWLLDELTPQELIDSHLKFKHGYGQPVKRRQAVAILQCSELAVLLGKDVNGADRLVAHLTELYGCQDTWSAGTRTSGKRVLNDVAITCVFGTTVDWIRTSITNELFSGGFFGRCILLYKERPSRYFPHPGPSDPVVRYELARMLAAWAGLPPDSVPAVWGKGSAEWFADWYMDNKRADLPHPLMGPYLERKQNHLLKTAMLLSASEHTHAYLTTEELLDLGQLPVEVSHLQLAKVLLEIEERRMPMCLEEVGQHASAGEADYLKSRIPPEGVTHTDLFRAVRWKVGTSKDFRELLGSLVESGEVIAEVTATKGQRYYLSTEVSRP